MGLRNSLYVGLAALTLAGCQGLHSGEKIHTFKDIQGLPVHVYKSDDWENGNEMDKNVIFERPLPTEGTKLVFSIDSKGNMVKATYVAPGEENLVYTAGRYFKKVSRAYRAMKATIDGKVLDPIAEVDDGKITEKEKTPKPSPDEFGALERISGIKRE